MSRLAGVFALLLVLWLAACTEPASPAIRFGLATEPVTLDPRFATDAVSHRLSRLLYRSLVDFDAAFRPVPQLATWEALAPTHYRFILNNDIEPFHHGKRLRAEDVKATYTYILDPANASPHRTSLTGITAIDVVDANTIDFYLEHADPLFPGRLVIGILPGDLVEQDHPFNSSPIGNGPMAFAGWPKPGQLHMDRLDGRDSIEFITVPDPTVRVLKLMRGELDLFQGELPPEMARWLSKQPTMRVEKSEGTTFSYLGFNLQDPLVGQKRIRQAIAYAIDRKAIIEHILDHTAHIASAMLPPAHWAGNPDLPSIAHNLAKAKSLLREAGYSPQHPLTLSYKTSSNPFRIRLATVIQHQLGAAGIQVDVRSYDWGTFYADIKAGRFQMYSLSWVGLKMPDIFRYVFHSRSIPPDGANRGRLDDAKIDALIEQAESTMDIQAKAKLYRRLQAALLEALPYVPLWYEDNVLARRANIQGYTLNPSGDYDALTQVYRQ